MSHKKHIITICIILLIVTTLGVFWYTQKNTNKFVRMETQEEAQEEKEKTNNEIVYNNDEKIDTSDWQTYRNEEYGFEIKYPQDFIISNMQFDNHVVFFVPKNDKKSITTGVSIRAGDSAQTYEGVTKLYKKNIEEKQIVTQNNFVINDNFTGKIIVIKNEMGYISTTYFFEKNNMHFEIKIIDDGTKKSKKIMNSIVQTFI